MNAWAILVAAGRGARSGLAYNKAFYRLNGTPVLVHSLNALQSSGCFDGAVLVLCEEDRDRFDEIARLDGPFPFLRAVVSGGVTRQESVYQGLLHVPESVSLIAVHDAARPFATPALIAAVVASAAARASGVAATKVTDTIKVAGDDGRVLHTPDRATLRAVQTPQAFLRAALLSAHQRAIADHFTATDDAALMERYEGEVYLVEHPDGEKNRKLTTVEDIRAMEHNTGANFRVGSGYDVHRLEAGRALVLCGEEIPYEKGLLGHSDADVALHALMDALLGALGEGDIGRHFPDNDPAYAGISSMALLDTVVERMTLRGYRAGNVDVTIIAQRPKLAPYRDRMRENLARALHVSIERINIKATTTEGLGFEGRGEGISAMATVLLERLSL